MKYLVIKERIDNGDYNHMMTGFVIVAELKNIKHAQALVDHYYNDENVDTDNWTYAVQPIMEEADVVKLLNDTHVESLKK